ncbi:hypothetical protein AHiyo1_09470 [Arthrobacter sp. Hiyo1]|uniref:hypothetical protein n=1 Tax=Arthrobacter sp. Hiyo1 TaxID=1588020 RepID=UPI00072376CB|nr:hypothetical protein [Arthrobacter sp. Hiyo1]GAP57985.1 hypothetical protein AHiyo1_09470 [Arthrobacter sp. Hiyo1]
MSVIFTAADLNTYSGKTLQSGPAAEVTASVNAYIETQTHRCWGETKTVVERYDWGKTLWLRHMDVTAVTAIKVGWPGQIQTTLPSSSYFNNGWGRITLFWMLAGRPSSPSGYYNDYIEVSYSYGTTAVPADLKEAAMGVALGMYNWTIAGGKEIVATSVGSFRQEYSGAVRGANTGPTPYKDAAEAHFMTIKGYALQRL